jgi:hypothetical protein
LLVLEVRVARVRWERPVLVLAAAVLAGTLAMVVQAIVVLVTARLLRPVQVAVAEAHRVIPFRLAVAVAVASASSVRVQRALAGLLQAVVVAVVLEARAVLHHPQMRALRAGRMVAAVVALTMTGQQALMAAAVLYVSSTPVAGALSHRQIQGTYKCPRTAEFGRSLSSFKRSGSSCGPVV